MFFLYKMVWIRIEIELNRAKWGPTISLEEVDLLKQSHPDNVCI